jgi:hypothetical protein
VTMDSNVCVDCSTALIGDIQRCGACHERHVAARPRSDGASTPNVFVRWVVAIELLGIAVLVLIFAVRGCSS